MRMLIAYDGSLHSNTALRYGIRKLREEGGRAVVLHVFHGGMFIDYGAGPGAEGRARQDARAHVENARRIIEETGAGLWIRVAEREGVPEEEIISCAEEERSDIILAPARYKSIIKRATCPVMTFPGNILVPVDNTGNSAEALRLIVEEAKATGSRVVVVGVVPVHMYGLSEKAEVRKLEKETRASMDEVKLFMRRQGVPTAETMRLGYADEEILKAVEEFSASMIIIPTVEDMPSELSKAACIILEETEQANKPVLLMPVPAGR